MSLANLAPTGERIYGSGPPAVNGVLIQAPAGWTLRNGFAWFWYPGVNKAYPKGVVIGWADVPASVGAKSRIGSAWVCIDLATGTGWPVQPDVEFGGYNFGTFSNGHGLAAYFLSNGGAFGGVAGLNDSLGRAWGNIGVAFFGDFDGDAMFVQRDFSRWERYAPADPVNMPSVVGLAPTPRSLKAADKTLYIDGNWGLALRDDKFQGAMFSMDAKDFNSDGLVLDENTVELVSISGQGEIPSDTLRRYIIDVRTWTGHREDYRFGELVGGVTIDAPIHVGDIRPWLWPLPDDVPLPLDATPIGRPIAQGVYKFFVAPDTPGNARRTEPDLVNDYPDVTFCYPESDQSIAWANRKGLGVMVGDRRTALLAKRPIGINVRIGEDPNAPDLDTQEQTSRPVSLEFDIPFCWYNDRADPWNGWPSKVRRGDVILVQAFVNYLETPDQFFSRFSPVLEWISAQPNVEVIDLTYSDFDRNLAGWPKWRLWNIQSVKARFLRAFPKLRSISAFCRDRFGADDQGRIFGGIEEHKAEMIPPRKALAAACVPSSSPYPWPRPSEWNGDDDMAANSFAIAEAELRSACWVVYGALDSPDAKNSITLNSRRLSGLYDPAEDWPLERALQDILVKKFPTLTVEQCKAAGNVVSVIVANLTKAS